MSTHEVLDMAFRTGDLRGTTSGMSLRRAQLGSEGHRKIQDARPESYLKEVPVEWSFSREGITLTVQGRIDGLMPRGAGWRLEEIKTTWSSWDRTASPNHWAQARLYGFFLCERDGLESIELQLTYLELDTDQITVFQEQWTHDDLREFVMPGIKYVLDRWSRRSAWIQLRNESLKSAQFPFPEYRPGQRQLAVSAYRVLRDGKMLCVEAPTGIGKTISTLFPALKALEAGAGESICYLTARNTGKALAEESLGRIRCAGARIRSVHWTSKSRICFCSGNSEDCHQPDGELCPYTVGYFDRIRGALDEALELDALDSVAASRIASAHQVCPHAMILDAADWFDVRIGDYNYRFDPQVAPGEENAAFEKELWLIDEAHHFPDRSREMYSTEIEISEVRALREALEKESGLSEIKLMAQDIEKEFERLTWDGWEGAEPVRVVDKSRGMASPRLPSKLMKPIQRFNKSFESRWSETLRPEALELAMNVFFKTWGLERCAGRWSENYAVLLEVRSRDSHSNSREKSDGIRMKFSCLDPSTAISERLNAAAGVVLFSGTIGDLDRFRNQIGVPCPGLRLPSPFPKENFLAIQAPFLSTAYSQREQSRAQVVQSIYAATSVRSGHYWVFFSSFEYMNQVYQEFIQTWPDVEVHCQRPDLSDEERQDFLNLFQLDPGQSATKTRIGMVILGGIFGEGVDLPGDSLVGVVIVGVGLPMIEPERQLLRSLMDDRGVDGFEGAYIFPGMQRALQAVGRVIRSPQDRGFAVLLDVRYRQHSYQRLLPEYWNLQRAGSIESLKECIQSFWSTFF